MAAKLFPTSAIRNIAFLSHSGVGKTTLVEAILFSKGVINRMGTVEEGNTTSDFRDMEIERKSSVNLSVMNVEHKGTKINILDTPGYADFVGEIYCALRVVEGCVILASAQNALEVGTTQAWGQKSSLPGIVFLNKMDRENADFHKAVEELREGLSESIIPFTIPIGAGEAFTGIVDVLANKAYEYPTSGKGVGKEIPVPADLIAEVQKLRAELIDRAAESDETLMEKFFSEGELSPEEIASGLAHSVASAALTPLFVGSATKLMGIDLILAAIANLIPAPDKVNMPKASKSIEGPFDRDVQVSADAPFAALVFKVSNEHHVGDLTFFRIFSGKTAPGLDVQNTTQNSSERIGLVYAPNGKLRDEAAELVAGDIACTVKLRNTKTNDTLSDKKDQIIIEPIAFPLPNVMEAIVSKNKGDEDKVATGLAKIHDEDPTFYYRVDSELHQTLVYGQGELQLEIVVKMLKNRFGTDVELIKPRIPYRETIIKTGNARYRHKKQSGGAGEFAEVEMRVEPNEEGAGFAYEWEIFGGSISKTYQTSIEKGINAAMVEGILAGYPVIDVKAFVVDGKEHPVDSKDVAFQKAGKEVFRQAFLSAGPILLEPIVLLEVIVPEEFTGDVMGDISSRRGRIQGMEPAGKNLQKVIALVPESELYKYSTQLRSMTQGRGWFSKRFDHNEPMPREMADKLAAELKRSDDE